MNDLGAAATVDLLDVHDDSAVRYWAEELRVTDDELRRVAALLGCKLTLIRSFLS